MDGAADDRPVITSSSRNERQHQTQSTRASRHDAQPRSREDPRLPARDGRSTTSSLALQRPLPRLPPDPVSRSRTASESPAPSLNPSLKRSVDDGYSDDDIEIAEPKIVRYSKVREKPTLLEISSPRNSTSSFNPSSPDKNANNRTSGSSRYNQQPIGSAGPSHDSDSSSGTSRWSDAQHPENPTTLRPRPQRSYAQRRVQEQNQQPESPTTLPPHPQLSFAQRRAQEQDQRPASGHPLRHVSRPLGGPRPGEIMQAFHGHEQGRRPNSLNAATRTYRGADTTMQPGALQSPQRQRYTDPQPLSQSYSTPQRPSTYSSLLSQTSPTPQRPSTYSAIRDLGAQMLSGTTFRRSAQVQAQQQTGRGSQSSQNAQLLSPAGRHPLRNSMPSRNPRNSGSANTPTRIALTEQRWSPRNAPPEPEGGVSWAEVLRQSPRHSAVIEDMIDQLNRPDSDRLNRSDSFKENRPPPEHYRD